MPGTVIGKDLALGFAGKVSRNPYNQIRNRFVKSVLNGSSVETASNVTFGHAVVLNTDNTVSDWVDAVSGLSGVSTATAAHFNGISVSEVKQSMTLTYGANTAAGQYEPKMPADILLSGTCTVICTEGTPTAGGAVYIVTGGTVTTSPVGSFVTASPTTSGATGIQLTNCSWTTGKQDSATGITELTINYPVNP
jgi:hypothetical protein